MALLNARNSACLVVIAAVTASACNRPSRKSGAAPDVSAAFVFGPSASVGRDGRIDLFVVGSTRTVWRSACEELPCDARSRYGDWLSEAGTPPRGVASRIGATQWGKGRYDLFVVGRDRRLWHQTRTGTRFMGWEDLGGELFSSPAAVSWADGRLDVFVAAAGEEIRQRYCQVTTGPLACRGSNWSQWVRLPGRPPSGFVGDPVATTPAMNHIDLAVLGRDGAVWYVGYLNGWGGWQSLGGQFASQPAIAGLGARTEIFALDAAGKLWRTSGANRVFEPFRPVEAHFDEAPIAVASQNRVELFARTKGGETLSHLSCDANECVAR